MFDRFFTGLATARDCFAVLRQDTRLIVFPLLSGVGCLMTLISFAVPIGVLLPGNLDSLLSEGREGRIPLWVWPVLFAFYFCNYFVIYFFNAALVHCALFRLRGLEASPVDGLMAACRRLPQLLAWALVSATVGLLLRVIESFSDRIGQIVAALLGMAWSVLTYFVVPVLVVEKVGPFKAIGRSMAILRDNWGEALGGRIGISFAMLPFFLLGVIVFVVGVVLIPTMLPVGVGLIALAIVFLILVGLVSATLEGILLAALYLYASYGEVPADFDRESLEGAFFAKANRSLF